MLFMNTFKDAKKWREHAAQLEKEERERVLSFHKMEAQPHVRATSKITVDPICGTC